MSEARGRDFSAVLMAGGKSGRMGRDKRWLTLPGDGRPLWERQMELLGRMGAARLILSLAGDEPGLEVPAGVEVVRDEVSGSGPLGGICAALRRVETAYLVVLAVDMALMDEVFLGRLVERAAGEGRGVIPRLRGRWEPLAAVWPRLALPLLEGARERGEFALQPVVAEAERRGMILVHNVEAGEERRFLNANTPEEWERMVREIASASGVAKGG